MTTANVLIASKVHPNSKESVETACSKYDYTLSQAIRKGLLMFIKDLDKQAGSTPTPIAQNFTPTETTPAAQPAGQQASTHQNINHFGATAPI